MSRRATTSHLGRYEIIGRIATGGMATVYLARARSPGGFAREFALKVIHPHLAEDPGFARRFREEAKIASRVRHSNVVTVIDADADQGYDYIASELIDGVTLRQLLVHREHPLSPPQAAHAIGQVARGLHALHGLVDDEGNPRGVVHRDLSPQNVMVDREGRIVLIDLGLAKAADQSEHTHVGILQGKLPYMSPEQTRLQPLDSRSDVFSLGAVLFEVAVGRPPFGDDHTTRTLERLQASEAASLREAMDERDLPLWLSQIILTCLRPDPEDRFQTAGALGEALDQELAAAGHQRPEIRRQLGHLAAAAQPHVAPIQPADPLVPRIVAARPTRTRPIAWVAVGALAVGAAVWGLRLAAAEPTSIEDTPPRPTGSLASDAASPRSAQPAQSPVPEPEPRVEQEADPDPTPAIDTDGSETDASAETGEPAAPAASRRRPRRRPKSGELKPNPYRGR